MHETDYPPLTPQELASSGQALFGGGWRGELARVFSVPESYLTLVENGRVAAPLEWRGRLIALAQDCALRALETASGLMWREASAAAPDVIQSPHPTRYA